MRKRCSRKIRALSAPMLINRGLQNDELEMRERQFVEAFAHGYAEKIHFDSLADMRNVLIIAAAHKDDTKVIELCNAMSIPLQAIRERHAKTGKFGATGEELKMMRAFCGVYKDWWMRQPVSIYEAAVDGLQRTIYGTVSSSTPAEHVELDAILEAA
jgi:hypothetical protein